MSFVARKQFSLGEWVNYVLLVLISLITLIPFFYVVSISLTDPEIYVPMRFSMIPERFSLAAYTYLLSTNSFLNSLYSTLFITIVGTILNVIVTFTMAYGLTKKSLPGRKIVLSFVVFTLVFNAGIVPHYLLVKELGLLNSYWALILISLTNAWSLIVVKSFMESLPSELEDAAKIDGCTDIGVFMKIIIPLSMPAVATFTLFFAVAHWNTYFNALIYITDSAKWTLQVLVKTLIIDSNSQGYATSSGDDKALPQETIRMASIVLAILPILLVYPFIQKYFAKGVMLGSIKG
ncbi:carbohydrate ABC transporter permease [Paenibacillus agricola]|uniref:Carbohydrate ABC transporter permease n=1 Tax=Paenibacillus agricola TaxID=2716264 RepID=A0ABX0JAC0_9BACL|nr:carbohydrate ABC transporter permease [Paenibacillus agricola]NHN32706.1 carbohydrate ABC transporter permease [Paenibacillus agricola]